MNSDNVSDDIKFIEKVFSTNLPKKYKQFLSEEVKNADAYEIQSSRRESIYIYNCKDLIGRNEIYSIKNVEPDYLLIGQDGDLGYFINIKNGGDNIYSLDLGALGSLGMDEESIDIYKLKN